MCSPSYRLFIIVISKIENNKFFFIKRLTIFHNSFLMSAMNPKRLEAAAATVELLDKNVSLTVYRSKVLDVQKTPRTSNYLQILILICYSSDASS